MSDDPRCCGSGTCIIDPEGRCWCGQVWNGHEMCAPALKPLAAGAAIEAGLVARGVVPRPMGGYGLPTCLRITVGHRDENRRFLQALDEVLA